MGNLFDETPEPFCHAFDLVVSTSVIEHIRDLTGYLEHIQAFLKPEGYFLVDAPAVEGMPQRLFPVPNYFNHEHINYFSKTSLDNLLGGAGMVRVNEEVYAEESGELTLHGLYRLGCAPRPWEKDPSSRQAIAEYFQKIDAAQQGKPSVPALLRDHSRLILWGAGSYTMQILAEYPDLIAHVECFIDNNSTKCGHCIQGKPILLPTALQQQQLPYPILLCAMRNIDDIRRQIAGMGIPNPVYEI